MPSEIAIPFGWFLVVVLSTLGSLLLLISIAARRQPDSEASIRLLAEQIARQAARQDEFAVAVERQAAESRQHLSLSLGELERSLALHAAQEAERHARRLDALSTRLDHHRDAMDSQLERLRADSAEKLEGMRRTVDEQLHVALERRLGASFQAVSERLEQVQRGLGEMQALAGDVGDLKRVLTNVKTRGTWGEAQLGSLLEQIFAPSQLATHVEVEPGSGERVEFAIRLPAAQAGDVPMLLPIDAKFPREDFERLLQAHERADAKAAEQSSRALEQRIRLEAKKIAQKYLRPPLTTDFAVLFVPVEGLFAELARRPGLLDDLQLQHRVMLAGPTTVAAILSSLQMGLRTLAVEQRSGEVRKLLVSVREEFRNFGQTLARTRDQLEKAAGTIGQAESRSRALTRRLDEVESLDIDRVGGNEPGMPWIGSQDSDPQSVDRAPN